MLAAVKQDGRAFQYASKELRADRKVVLKAVEEDGGALQYASEELRADREMVLGLAAVMNYRLALRYASEELRADREVVLKAVGRFNGDALHMALQYASEELRADYSFTYTWRSSTLPRSCGPTTRLRTGACKPQAAFGYM